MPTDESKQHEDISAMRGLELVISGDYNYKVLSLLKYLDINQYAWHMPEFEYIATEDDDEIIYREKYSGEQLSEFIDFFKDHFILEINIRAFPLVYSAMTAASLRFIARALLIWRRYIMTVRITRK